MTVEEIRDLKERARQLFRITNDEWMRRVEAQGADAMASSELQEINKITREMHGLEVPLVQDQARASQGMELTLSDEELEEIATRIGRYETLVTRLGLG